MPAEASPVYLSFCGRKVEAKNAPQPFAPPGVDGRIAKIIIGEDNYKKGQTMDRVRAERLGRELAGKEVGGWQIGELLGNGASAAVFKVTRGADTAALKLIDPELEERFGAKEQEQRVLLENKLVGMGHPHLIKIYGGGRCSSTNYLYVAMEYMPGSTLTSKIPTFPKEKIRQTIKQIASAALYLEELGYSHRDIKPDNIVISEDLNHAVLLDLGILRPMTGSVNGTGDAFIGTTRYSPPEFLMREEEDNTEGWRAVTFYQLGAVLHDLLMRRPMFADVPEPYAKLIDAVRGTTPVIDTADATPGLVTLARSCLNKHPRSRLALVSWDDFAHEPASSRSLAQLKEQLRRRQQCAPRIVEEAPVKDTSLARQLDCLLHTIDALVREVCQQAQTFPRLEIQHSITNFSGTIEVKAGPSAQHELANPLFIQIGVSIVDGDGPSIVIAGRASIVEPLQEMSSGWLTVFRGTADTSEMRAALDLFVHCALEAGQSAGPSIAGHALAISV